MWRIFRTDTVLPKRTELLLSLLPFLILIGLYMYGAYHLRAMEAAGVSSAASKLMPLPSDIWEGFKIMAFEKDRGHYPLWEDTAISLQRFAEGMLIVASGIIIGLFMGTFPAVKACLNRSIVWLDKVSPVALLPILFMIFHIGEVSKVALIVVGLLPGLIQEACLAAESIPRDQRFKSQTLGASEAAIALTIILPQILPKMIDTLRLTFKSAWGYVLVAEGLAASSGIGYRIFIMQRQMSMDVIVAYVLWATAIMFILDYAFQWWITRLPLGGKIRRKRSWIQS